MKEKGAKKVTMASKRKPKASGVVPKKAAKPLHGPRAKKPKLSEDEPDIALDCGEHTGRQVGQSGQSYELESGSHPYGVRPMGNMYFEKAEVNVRDVGLGDLCNLSDEQVLDILGRLDARDLCRVAQVSDVMVVVVVMARTML